MLGLFTEGERPSDPVIGVANDEADDDDDDNGMMGCAFLLRVILSPGVYSAMYHDVDMDGCPGPAFVAMTRLCCVHANSWRV